MTEERERQPHPSTTKKAPIPPAEQPSQPLPLQPGPKAGACASGDAQIDDGSDPCPPGVKSGRGA
jgi:hypothetical protein